MMLSRVAESIYWMSRQVERAENLARFIEVTLHLTLDQQDYLIDPWEPLVKVTGDEEWFEEHYDGTTRENVVRFLGFDHEYHNSMLTCLAAARENARGVREKMSSEAFEGLNDFYHFVGDNAESQSSDPTSEFFAKIRWHSLMWSGILDCTMLHDSTWHFINLGRLLERADKTSRILDVKYFNLLPSPEFVGTAVDDLQWSNLLLAVSGFEAYRREHHLVDVKKIVSFFLFHETFPRSVVSCIAGVQWSLSKIDNGMGDKQIGEARRRVEKLRHRLSKTTVEEVIAGGMHQFIDRLQIELNEIGNSLATDYFHLTAEHA